ncbi:hypothetical protein GGR56DRAFT_678581 [Xylariaceae sp. FL0804]|nr:hypothetical protein GGR56DRAFT_678581 [Xylariaceae sp. FL0804]
MSSAHSQELSGKSDAAFDNGDDHVKRPPNMYMLWRKATLPTFKARLESEGKIPNWANISGLAKEEWAGMGPAEKKQWADKAAVLNAEHKARNPGYVYQPKKKTGDRTAKKPAARAKAKAKAA